MAQRRRCAINPYIKTTVMAMVPLVELRGAIPMGLAMGLDPLEVFLLTTMASLIPAPVIIPLFRPLTEWLRTMPLFSRLVDQVVHRALRGKKHVIRYGLLGLAIFVAIPLPGTGVYSGSFLAAILNIRMRYSLPAIALGNFVAGLLILGLSTGIIHIFT